MGNWDPYNSEVSKHKVFLSYYHDEDQYYRDKFESDFGHLFISKSVNPGDIETDLSTEYIKRLIQEGYITDSSVLAVLVGPKTCCRKHVDWEISAGLNKKAGGYSGLIGILLPEFPKTNDGKYYTDNLPARLADNVNSGYAVIYTWSWICESDNRVKDAIEKAFNDRIDKSDKIDNSRKQLGKNLCD